MLMFRQWCILHQLQLTVKRQLSRKTEYWSILAKVVNSWRAPGAALKLFRAWTDLYDHERAQKVAQTLPPRPLRGRWGSAAATEEFLIRDGHEELPTVFRTLLRGMGKRKRKGAVELGEMDDDEEAFGERKNRWAREASVGISTNTFWRYLYICHVSRGPITHLLYWFQRVAPDKSHMVTFACEKAKQIKD